MNSQKITLRGLISLKHSVVFPDVLILHLHQNIFQNDRPAQRQNWSFGRAVGILFGKVHYNVNWSVCHHVTGLKTLFSRKYTSRITVWSQEKQFHALANFTFDFVKQLFTSSVFYFLFCLFVNFIYFVLFLSVFFTFFGFYFSFWREFARVEHFSLRKLHCSVRKAESTVLRHTSAKAPQRVHRSARRGKTASMSHLSSLLPVQEMGVSWPRRKSRTRDSTRGELQESRNTFTGVRFERELQSEFRFRDSASLTWSSLFPKWGAYFKSRVWRVVWPRIPAESVTLALTLTERTCLSLRPPPDKNKKPCNLILVWEVHVWFQNLGILVA